MERRHTAKVIGDVAVYPVAADTLIELGNAVGLVDGLLEPVDPANPDQVMVGLAIRTVDNRGGAAGAVTAEVEEGTFRFRNSSSTDAVTYAHVGGVCFAIDGGTVSSTSDTTDQPPMGIVRHLTSKGIEVLVSPLASAQARALLIAAEALEEATSSP